MHGSGPGRAAWMRWRDKASIKLREGNKEKETGSGSSAGPLRLRVSQALRHPHPAAEVHVGT